MLRRNTQRTDPISLKGIDSVSGARYRCTSGWLHVGVASLLQRFKGRHYEIPTGISKQRSDFVAFTELVGARFVLFRVKSPLSEMTLCADFIAKVERTFAMALKGGLGLFSKCGDKLRICSIHFDGDRHYERPPDLATILRKIDNPPPNVEFARDVVLHSGSSDHRIDQCQSYDDCQLLQLTDLFVSGFRTVLYAPTHPAQMELCKPLAQLANTWARGPKGYGNSRWFKGFSIGEGYIDDGRWMFGPIEKSNSYEQRSLPGFS